MSLELNKIHKIDALQGLKLLKNDSIDCVVTSPPYYGLRDYGVEGQLGLESTYIDYLDKLVEIFDEVKRVLKPTGIFYLNIGDSYSNYKDCKSPKQTMSGDSRHSLQKNIRGNVNSKLLKKFGFKNKDLMNIPYRLLFRLIDTGWYHRQTIIWAKAVSGDIREGAVMPESVEDRFVQAWEPIFMLTKKDKYFFDFYGVKESSSLDSDELANMRNVWRINLRPGESGKHIAGYPEKIPELCIKSATTSFGCCSECGIPYKRILKNDGVIPQSWAPGSRDKHKLQQIKGQVGQSSSFLTDSVVRKAHSHFEQQCKCETNTLKSAVILDPFMGSGTTALSALKLGRDFIGFEINDESIDFTNDRIKMFRFKNKLF